MLVFIGVAAIVIVMPGPDTAVVTKNVLLHGRRAALGTSLGVSAGLLVWTLAAAVGVASVVRANSELRGTTTGATHAVSADMSGAYAA